jgi:integrase
LYDEAKNNSRRVGKNQRTAGVRRDDGARYQPRLQDLRHTFAVHRLSPHTIRHTTATHLLRAGVDINTIRAWLGHVSLNTTNIYAEVDLEMKAKALARCEVSRTTSRLKWRDDKDLMEFLRNL